MLPAHVPGYFLKAVKVARGSSDASRATAPVERHCRACTAAQVAEECLQKAGDLSGLLLLYTAKGSGNGLADLIKDAGAQNRQNIVFLCHLLLGNLNACVDLLIASSRIPEAAFFARTYVPSRMTEVC